MSDRDRIRAAAALAASAAMIVMAGFLLNALGSLGGWLGLTLLLLGVVGLAHSVLLGLGFATRIYEQTGARETGSDAADEPPSPAWDAGSGVP